MDAALGIVIELLLQLVHGRHRTDARFAPARPYVDQHQLTLKGVKCHLFTVQIRQNSLGKAARMTHFQEVAQLTGLAGNRLAVFDDLRLEGRNVIRSGCFSRHSRQRKARCQSQAKQKTFQLILLRNNKSKNITYGQPDLSCVACYAKKQRLRSPRQSREPPTKEMSLR